MLVLEPGLDEVQREDAGDADDAGDAAIDDLGQEGELGNGGNRRRIRLRRGCHLSPLSYSCSDLFSDVGQRPR